MNENIIHPKRFTRIGLVRRWWHRRRGHKVTTTVVRDMRSRGQKVEFYFRPGWFCVDCRAMWP